MNCLRRLRLAPLPPPRLPVSSFPRFVSSVPPPALASSLSPPRPPQKHKSKKAKKPTLPTTTPAEPLVLPLGLPRAGKEVDREADGRAIALSTAESYDTPALLKGLQALGLLGDVQGSAVNLVGEAIVRAPFLPESVLIEGADEVNPRSTSLAGVLRPRMARRQSRERSLSLRAARSSAGVCPSLASSRSFARSCGVDLKGRRGRS